MTILSFVTISHIFAFRMDGILNGKAYKDEIGIFGSNLGEDGIVISCFFFSYIYHTILLGVSEIIKLQLKRSENIRKNCHKSP